MQNLIFIGKLFIIYVVLLEAVTSVPQTYKASDGKEYLIETDLKYNWYEAWHECARRDSQLVIIDSAPKNNAIIDLLKEVIGKSHDLWLGGNDEYNPSTEFKRPFYWSATGERFTFTFWSVNNPDNYRSKEHCVHIWNEKPLYQWNDNECTTKMGFICGANHYAEKYQKELKNKCDAVQQSGSSISIEFSKSQQQQLSEIRRKIEKTDCLEQDWQVELQLMQNNTQVAMQKALDEQQIMLKQLTQKVFKQFNDLNIELRNSTVDINKKFGSILNTKEHEINQVC